MYVLQVFDDSLNVCLLSWNNATHTCCTFATRMIGQALAPEVVAEDVGKGLGKVRTFGQVRIPDDGGKVVEDEAAVEGRKVDEGRRDENEDSWNHGRLHAWLWS